MRRLLRRMHLDWLADRWPVAVGVALAMLVLLVVGALGDALPERILGIGAGGWLVALGALCAGLTLEIWRDDRMALDRERRLVQAAASLSRTTAEMEQIATHDQLTGLATRRVGFERLGMEFQRAVRYGRPISVLMADLDRFKDVNDRYGHLFGDHVLAAVAHVMAANVRQSDVVARYGGEEFLVILPEASEADAVAVAEKLRHAVGAELIRQGDVVERMTVSIGVVSIPPSRSADAEGLIALADAALYAAKRAGRDRVALAGAPVPVTNGDGGTSARA